MVRVGVREQHRMQRLPELFEPCTHRATVGNGEKAVNRDHAQVGLDKVGVDERPLLLSRVAMNRGLVGHTCSFRYASLVWVTS